MTDGRIVVADGLTRELSLFDSLGVLLMSMRGEGDGPSEFQRLDRIGTLHEDSIVARDVGAFKTVVFDSNGQFARVVPGPPLVWNELRGVLVVGWLADGSSMVTHVPQEPPPGRNLIERQWHLFDPEGTHVRQVAQIPHNFATNRGEGGGALVLGPEAEFDVIGTGLWHGFPERYELRHYGPQGLRRIVRRAWQGESVPDRAETTYHEWFAAEYAPELPASYPASAREQLTDAFEARVEEMVFSDTFPAFTDLIVARSGHLWVREPATTEELEARGWDWSQGLSSRAWSVFTPEGRWLGTVMMPDDLEIQDIGEDYVMGVRTDELDVEYVALHRIEKP